MECPAEMAESFLRKWKEENTVLVVTLSTSRLHLTMGGTVVDFEGSAGVVIAALAVQSPSGEITAAPGELTVGFEDAEFEYSDPRESPDDIRENFEAMFVCLLTARVPGENPELILTLTEMRH
jgi:hypothetical protein